MRSWYKKDAGKTLLYGEEADIESRHPSAVKIPDRPGEDFVWVNDSWVSDPEAYRRKRAAEYPPVGDQLDAIWKQLSYMQMNLETNLVVEADDIMGKWLAVKRKYPKPE